MSQREDGQRALPFMSEVEHFVASSVWKYMAEEIASIMMQAATENDELDPYKDAAMLCRNQGVIKLGKMILDMPAQLSEEIKLQAEKPKQEEEE